MDMRGWMARLRQWRPEKKSHTTPAKILPAKLFPASSLLPNSLQRDSSLQPTGIISSPQAGSLPRAGTQIIPRARLLHPKGDKGISSSQTGHLLSAFRHGEDQWRGRQPV